MTKILLVEDEVILADTLLLSMQKLGYQCAWVKTLREARKELSHQRFDLMVLDRNLPDGDGIELLKYPHRKGVMTLVLSAKSGLEDRIAGLQSGADDYLPKPFSFQELAARLEALVRRKPEASSTSADATHGGVAGKTDELWKCNPETLEVLVPSGWMTCTPLEFKFLCYLIEKKGTIVSKDRLLKDVWGFTFLPKTRTVDYIITQLRKRIEPNPEQPKHLLTVRGAGIKFVE